MQAMKNLVRKRGMQGLSVLIAVILWFQVHGQGQGSLSMDVPLQVQGLPQDMVIVNDLPDHIRVTVSGLQARISGLSPQAVHVPLDASELNEPGVVERAIKVSSIRLPAGLNIEKLQPDKVELQVDRVVTRTIRVQPHLVLPDGWNALKVSVNPESVKLTGPEVWLDALPTVDTSEMRLETKSGPFEVNAGLESPAGKSIRLTNAGIKVIIRGVMVRREETN